MNGMHRAFRNILPLLAITAGMALFGAIPARALEAKDLVGVWSPSTIANFKDPADGEYLKAHNVPVDSLYTLDFWMEKTAGSPDRLIGFFANVWRILPLTDIKLEGDAFSAKVDHKGDKPESISGVIDGSGAMSVKVKTPYYDGYPQEMSFKRVSHGFGRPDVPAKDLSGLYSGTVDILPGVADPSKTAKRKFQISIHVGEKEVTGSIVIGETKCPFKTLLRDANRIYAEWESSEAPDKSGRMLASLEDGAIIASISDVRGYCVRGRLNKEDEPK